MRTICAWCQRELRPGAEPADDAVSHGICSACIDEFMRDDTSLRGFLNRLGVPVLAVDRDGCLATANDLAGEAIGRPVDELRGMTGGDAFACCHARLPGGCGHTVHCRTCTIRRTVMHTHATGEPCHEVLAHQDRLVAGELQRTMYRVSTELLGQCVLLRIDFAACSNPVPGTQIEQML